jgi:hypothetical protein
MEMAMWGGQFIGRRHSRRAAIVGHVLVMLRFLFPKDILIL